MPVNISLADVGLWNTYGVSGFGMHRYFIKQLKEPRNFQYLDRTLTGYGGVLLIGGVDPFTNNTDVPLAYDLSCPVERKPDIRVRVDVGTYEAICPECGSKYDVTMAGGSPVSGPAAADRYALRRYQCVPSGTGYIITN